MKKIICFWGSPGAGKSTICAGTFYQLKMKGFSCEMNREYIKDWVWEDRSILQGDQSYIFAKQARKERLYIKNNIDFIITDSPMALSIYYGRKYDKYENTHNACVYLLKQHHDFCKDYGYKVDHYFLPSTKKYDPKGRYQTEEEAKKIGDELRAFLYELGINYKEVYYSNNIVNEIVGNYV